MEIIDSSTYPPAVPKPKLRWYQYSLRSLFILTFLVAIASSWFAVKMGQARRQKRAVEAIRKMDGYVAYYYQRGSDFLIKGDAEPHDFCLHNVFGIDFFNNVSFVFLKGEKVFDKDLENVKELNQIVVLVLDNSRITDAALKNLIGFYNLKTLSLDNTEITDAGLSYIEKLINLNYLHLRHTKVTDAGITKLQKALPNCKIER